MNYEVALLLRPDLSEEDLSVVKNLYTDVLKEYEGEVLLTDDWGTRALAWPTKSGLKRAKYLYLIYKANNKANGELKRRLNINEAVVRALTIKLDRVKSIDKYIKDYQAPFA